MEQHRLESGHTCRQIVLPRYRRIIVSPINRWYISDCLFQENREDYGSRVPLAWRRLQKESTIEKWFHITAGWLSIRLIRKN